MATPSLADDPIAKQSREFSKQLNENHAASILMFAWYHGGYTDATLAIIRQIDSFGFDLRCLLANQDAAEVHITFSKPANNADDVNQEFVRLRREAAFPHRPPGMLPIAMIFMWIAIVCIYIEAPDGDGDHRGRDEWFGLREHVPSRPAVAIGAACIFLSNLLTAGAVAYIAHRRLRLHVEAVVAWFLLTIVLGYPMAQQALALKRISGQAKLKMKNR